MAGTYNLFDALRAFENIRSDERQKFLEIKRKTERFKGSAGYESEMREAAAKRKAVTDAARKEAARKIDEAVKQMRDSARKAPLDPPSPEMVSILQILSMRSKITLQELDRAARNMKGNGLALSALNDLADRHYFPGSQEGQAHTNYNQFSTDLNEQKIDDLINDIVRVCSDRLKTSAKKPAFDSATFMKNHRGLDFDEDSLAQNEALTSETGFFRGIVGNDYDAFMRVVNG